MIGMKIILAKDYGFYSEGHDEGVGHPQGRCVADNVGDQGLLVQVEE